MTDRLPELADDDLDVLLEALEAWENKDMASDMAGDLIEAALTPRGDSMRPEVAAQRERDKQQRAADKHMRKERSVLLRAKIITIRDRRRSERMTQEVLQPQR